MLWNPSIVWTDESFQVTPYIVRAMEWLNYHHLLYFWMVAREGSIVGACKELNLAQPTISGQLRSLEESLGEKLFRHVGRRLVLTETGQLVFQYADEIFGLGRELSDVLKGRPRGRPLRLTVGISDLIPKLIAYRILQPAFALKERVQLVCYEDNPDQLLLDLSAHRLDLVLSHTPAGAAVGVRVFNHRLGSCGVSLFATGALAARYRKAFPAHLDGAPFLLPMERSATRRALEQWFVAQRIRPQTVGEFQDSALLGAFGQAGAGIFAAPSAIELEVRRIYRVSVIGRLDSVFEEFYAVSAERKIKHPAVVAITETARNQLFAAPSVQ
jgi:LysR family transcriptional regulator, transcriptional activator of nhaA